MVSLTVAAFFAAVGFVAFFGGWQFRLPTVSIVGALMLVALGAVIMDGDLVYRTGTKVAEVSNSTTEKSATYSQVPTPSHFPLGAMVLLLGGLGVLQSLDQYSKLNP